MNTFLCKSNELVFFGIENQHLQLMAVECSYHLIARSRRRIKAGVCFKYMGAGVVIHSGI